MKILKRFQKIFFVSKKYRKKKTFKKKHNKTKRKFKMRGG